ncbi:MAG: UDP-N-acetylmuramoylalanine--D-glutamate ligase, partial [Chloroflexota bacterium]|nr:UDP-N-acetylmuramoylalanine--D-glutamate ligase [Chloroflexota bacterium]
LVLNAEDPVVADYAVVGSAPAVRYRRDRPLPGGVGVIDGWIVAADVERLPLAGGGTASTGPDRRIMPVDALAIPGAHNVSNALAAVAVGLLFGVAPEAIRAAAEAFTGVEHRLEPVAVIDGVRFINDSQGTQPDAVIAALRAFEAPVVLIAGGRDKGVDLDELAAVVGKRVAAAVLIGETGPELERRFRDAGLERIERAGSMDEAVTRADVLAREALDAVDAHDTDDTDDARDAGSARPDGLPPSLATVLLSPAAASFDMFPDYAARGRAFKSAVAALAAARAGRDR